MLVISTLDGPATHSQIKAHNPRDTTSPTYVQTISNTDKVKVPWSLMEGGTDTLRLMQRTDPFCKHISKWLLNGKAPSHEMYIFLHIKGLLYKRFMDSNQKFLALVAPKSWHFTVLVEAHDKLGCQGVNRTYHLIRCQHYWKGMNKDIHKYINHCTLCNREKSRTQLYPLQMTDIPDRPFDKIYIDLVSDLNIFASGNQHIHSTLAINEVAFNEKSAIMKENLCAKYAPFTYKYIALNEKLPITMQNLCIFFLLQAELSILTIIDHLMGWQEAFPIPTKKAGTIVCVFINNYLPIHMCPCFILSDKGAEFKDQLMNNVLKQLGIDLIFSTPYHPQGNGKLEVFHKYLKPTPKKLCENDPGNWDKYTNHILANHHVTPHLATTETPFFLVYGRDPNLPLHQLLEPMQQFLGDPEFGHLDLQSHCLALAIAKKCIKDNRLHPTWF